jgi:LacI family transcriptional regulator
MLATRHLIALGHRDIAHLQLSGSNSRARGRRAGWQAALRESGITPAGDLVVNGGTRPETGYRAMMELLSRARRPTAAFAGSLLTAVGALTAARDAGLAVPADMSIVGFHDSWFAEHVQPPLTVVRLPLRAMGRQGVQLLVRRIEGADAQQILVNAPEPELVPRGSTAPPRRTRS